MKYLITGGTGHIGAALVPQLRSQGHQVTLLSRTPKPGEVQWDGRTLGDWASQVDGADVVLNMAGRTVDCRYTAENLRQMMDSRVDSTRVMGQAIAAARRPPRVWLQMSTATIYSHRFDAPNDETTGEIGGNEPDAPAYWRKSIEIAQAWEQAQSEAETPHTRKVLLRTAMVMNAVPGSVFRVLSRLVKLRLGGKIAGGRQFMSWIHADDFARAIDLLVSRDDISGPFNLAAPNPLPQKDFMAVLRRAWGVKIGLPATKWMCEIGAFVLRTDTELLFKSRRVIPQRLLDAGFEFRFPAWEGAACDLVSQCRA